VPARRRKAGHADGVTDDDLLEAFRRAERFFDAGRPTEAATLLEPVVEAAPESTAALELLARAYFESAQLARAETALLELVARRPDDGWARIALARTLERQGRPDEARGHRRAAEAMGH
jgi:Flp pilus assembly protein TadD